VWTNEANSHKSFVSVFPVVYNVPRGPVTIKLDRLNAQTNTDGYSSTGQTTFL
jgi:hypothetical protein